MAAPFTLDQLTAMTGQTVYDRSGEKIGDLKAVYHDDATGQAEWLGVSSGFLGTKTVLVPVAGATRREGGLLVAYSKDQVKDAPGAAGDHVSEAEEQALYQHYGLDYSRRRSSSGLPAQGQGIARDNRQSVERANVGTEGRTLELREEELQARKERVQAGEVEVRKEVVSEQRTIEVPVTREEVVVERRDVNQPSDRPIGEATNEVVEVPVYEEEVTAEKRTVVREEIEIGKRAVQETQQVSGTVRREEARVEQTGDVRGGSGGWESEMPRYRSRWEQQFGSRGGRWEDHEPGYRYGWEMANDQRYRGRRWTEAEADLRRDWETRHRDKPWDRARDSIRDAWENVTH